MIKSKIMKLYKSLAKKNKIYLFDYSKNSFFEGVYRLLALIISPLLIWLNPNIISILSLLSGFLGLILAKYFVNDLHIIIYFFFISFIFDFADGLVARHQKKTSFHGRFIDGLFDILVIGFLHIIFINYLFNLEYKIFNNNFYYITLLLLPIQHLILDRFSALARWCNSINKKNKIKPYYRNTYLNFITSVLLDLQHFCMFLVLFSSLFDLQMIIEIYYILSFSASIITIVLYIFLSDKFLRGTSNQSDNKD